MGVTHTFVSIERDEYHKLYDYVSEKRLRVKNIEDNDAVWREKLEDIWSSSDESHDAYLDKVKAEGRERTAEAAAGTFAGADFSDDDEDDEDFNPPEMNSSESDIAEEYDSNAQSSSDSDSSSAAGSTPASSASSSSASTPRQKKAKKAAPLPRQSDKKERKKTSKKDPNAPSRPPTAYFLWFNEHRQDIKMSLGGSVGVAEVAKAAGEKWKTVSAEEKAKYQLEADKLKEQYDRDMRVYKEKIASGELEEPVKSSVKKTKTSPTKMQKKTVTGGVSSSQSGGGGAFKSAEYVSESESSSSVSAAGKAGRRGDSSVGSGSMTDLSD